ncbi:DUF4097 family beta strand repeat-containing protein [Spirilliplanes yamanashiensis]|uniref:DUF4097 domain-containing protein n=1 Tax=Spirilliplanes yamanashiensis TaxID=42233 RepID=A0A8J3YCI0_9ACTN|nr:DUF4097 family beta strand repeat-containing protein [Spirilliplanes yamanashiensis]MDP9816521.1 hypothetical protein [Spirilliplanes yamanashiensis]GIJ06048.1 hypothetical protein Sya03_54000 [Spirilliplanes yamanashiensis]
MNLTRALGVAALAGTLSLTGCFATPQAQLEFSDTETAKITEIRLSGGAGDVLVRSSSRADTAVNRVVRYRGAEPERTYRIEGSVLTIDTRCGNDCFVTYDIEAPAGVAVTGSLGSGDIRLTRVGKVDVELQSGDVTVDGATGTVAVRTTSGDIVASGVKGAVELTATSGDVEARGIAGAVTAETTSGNVELRLAEAVAVRARASNGDVTVAVPQGAYRVQVATGNGDQEVSVPDVASAAHLLDVVTDNGDVYVRFG